LAIAALLAGMTSTASAEDPTFAVNSSLGSSCGFTTAPDAVVEVPPTVGQTMIGELGYTCNFSTSSGIQPHLVLDLPNGTVLSNGEQSVVYDVFWGIPPNPPTPGNYQNWPLAAVVAFNWFAPATANDELKGQFWVRLTTPITIAGTYTSVISYTISP